MKTKLWWISGVALAAVVVGLAVGGCRHASEPQRPTRQPGMVGTHMERQPRVMVGREVDPGRRDRTAPDLGYGGPPAP